MGFTRSSVAVVLPLLVIMASLVNLAAAGLTDEQKADLEADYEAQRTPFDDVLSKIHMAVVEEDLAQLAHLLDLSHPEHGPIDINNERYVDMHGMPALWFAISHISAGVARVLLQAGASVAWKESGTNRTALDTVWPAWDEDEQRDMDDPTGGWGTREWAERWTQRRQIEKLLKAAKAGTLAGMKEPLFMKHAIEPPPQKMKGADVTVTSVTSSGEKKGRKGRASAKDGAAVVGDAPVHHANSLEQLTDLYNKYNPEGALSGEALRESLREL